MKELQLAFLRYWKDGNLEAICAIVHHAPKNKRAMESYFKQWKKDLKQLNNEIKHINKLLEVASKPYNGYSSR